MQHVHTLIPTDELNGHLDEGAAVVWIDPHGTGVWDAVLDHPEFPEDKNTVLAFLQSVNTAALDEQMVKGVRLSQSPGESALRALMNMVLGAQGGP